MHHVFIYKSFLYITSVIAYDLNYLIIYVGSLITYVLDLHLLWIDFQVALPVWGEISRGFHHFTFLSWWFVGEFFFLSFFLSFGLCRVSCWCGEPLKNPFIPLWMFTRKWWRPVILSSCPSLQHLYSHSFLMPVSLRTPSFRKASLLWLVSSYRHKQAPPTGDVPGVWLRVVTDITTIRSLDSSFKGNFWIWTYTTNLNCIFIKDTEIKIKNEALNWCP